MPKYGVTATITISVYTEVTAASPSDAKKEALKQPMQSLCHQCSSEDSEEYWTMSELDGSPRNLDVEDIK